MKSTHYRQGDILLVRVDAIPNTAVTKDNIIARGETTGHCHQFTSNAVQVFVDQVTQQQYVRVAGQYPADLMHEEHNTIHVQPGEYRVVQQREYTLLEETRRVTD